jgi:hypothetical protein
MTKWRWLMVGFLMLYVPLSRDLVLAALWDWCVSTLGVPQIRVVQAWGLWLITTFLRMTHPLDERIQGTFWECAMHQILDPIGCISGR